MPYRRPSDGVFVTNFQRDHVRYRRSTGTTHRRAAERYERELIRTVERANAHGRREALRPHTFGEALTRWLDEGAPESMYGHIRLVAERIAPATPLERVHTEANVYAHELRRAGRAARTANNRLACIRRILRLAYARWEWLEQPTAAKVELLPERGSERDVTIGFGDLHRLCGATTHPLAPTVFLLAALSGARKNELLSVQPGDWRVTRYGEDQIGVLTIRTTKSGRPRRVPIPTPLHPLLETLPLRIGYRAVSYQFERARARCDLEHVQYRDLRHVYASWIGAEPDARAAMLRDLLGHSDLRTTSRYLHNVSDAAAVVESLYARLAEEHTLERRAPAAEAGRDDEAGGDGEIGRRWSPPGE